MLAISKNIMFHMLKRIFRFDVKIRVRECVCESVCVGVSVCEGVCVGVIASKLIHVPRRKWAKAGIFPGPKLLKCKNR